VLTCRSVAGLSVHHPCTPYVPEGGLEDGGEVVAVGGLVPPGGQPLLLQDLQGGVGGHHRVVVQGARTLGLAVHGLVRQAGGLPVDGDVLLPELVPCKPGLRVGILAASAASKSVCCLGFDLWRGSADWHFGSMSRRIE